MTEAEAMRKISIELSKQTYGMMSAADALKMLEEEKQNGAFDVKASWEAVFPVEQPFPGID